MELPNMQFAASEAYRYGFNGKENDKEWGTASLTQDYGFRLYNPAIAKFLSVDPLAKSYPWNSPYAFAENDVIRCIDLDGLEKIIYTEHTNRMGFKLAIKVLEASGLLKEFEQQFQLNNQNLDTYIFSGEMNDNEGETYPKILNLKNIRENLGTDISGMSPETLDGFQKAELNHVIKYYYKTKEEIKSIYSDILKGRGVAITAINKNHLDGLEMAYSLYQAESYLNSVTGKKSTFFKKIFSDMLIDVADTIIHELKAHVLNKKNGTYKNMEDDHYRYHGNATKNTPKAEELKKDTEAYKDHQKNEKGAKEVIEELENK